MIEKQHVKWIIIFCILLIRSHIVIKIVIICYRHIKIDKIITLQYLYYKMTRNNELKRIGIKTRTYCYFDDMMNVNVFNLKNIIVD